MYQRQPPQPFRPICNLPPAFQLSIFQSFCQLPGAEEPSPWKSRGINILSKLYEYIYIYIHIYIYIYIKTNPTRCMWACVHGVCVCMCHIHICR